MQIKLPRRTLIVGAAAVAVSSLAIASLPANAAAEPGISATEIVLGMQLPQTGAASPGYNKVDDAMRAYFDYVNSKGGVNGRKIRLEVKDDEYKAGKTITTASSLINKEKVFAMVGSIGTQTHISVIGDLNRRKIPDIFINSGYSGFYTDPKKYPYSFGGLGTYVVEAKILGKYIKENFADKKVGILYQTDDFGRNALQGFTNAGLTFVKDKTSVNFIAGTQGSIGLANQLGTLKANGVQVVIFASVASATAVAVSTAAALGYKPDKWVVMSVGADATTFQTILGSKGVPAATSAALLTGIISASHAPAPGEDTDPYVVAFKKINDDFNKGPDKRWDNNILQGMNIAYQTTAALMGVGKDLTRAKLVAYLENNGSKISSGALVPLGYSKTTHEAFTGFWIGAYNASTVLTPITTPRVVYTTDSGTGPVTVSNYVRPAIAADALPKVG